MQQLSIWNISSKQASVESSDQELASLVLQKAADYNSSLEDHLPSLSDTDMSECESLSTEYFIMRTAMVRTRAC